MHGWCYKESTRQPWFRKLPKASVNVLRGKIYLLARLPKKSGQPGLMPQRIPTGLNDTPADHKVADKRRAHLQRQIDQGTFSWDDWVDQKGVTWRKAIDALYRKRVVIGRTGQSTWEVNYMGRLRQLDMTKEVTPQSVAAAIQKYDRDQCSYKELYYLLQDLCQLVAVPFPEVPVPTYRQGQLKEVPDDAEILDCLSRCSGQFKWHLAMICTYGLRPQETIGAKFVDDRHRIHVPEDTKTGFRVVTPVPPDWVDLFDLRNEQRREKPGLNQWMHEERKKAEISWTPNAGRHAYAGRLWRYGGSSLDIYTAARLMGHSVSVHAKTYRQFIDPVSVAQKAEDAITQNFEAVAKTVAAQL